MNLKNEIPVTWTSVLGFAWAIFWRFIIISLPYDLAINFIWIPETSGELAMFYLLDGIVFFFALIVAIFWVQTKGYGNKRVILFNTSSKTTNEEEMSTQEQGEKYEF